MNNKKVKSHSQGNKQIRNIKVIDKKYSNFNYQNEIEGKSGQKYSNKTNKKLLKSNELLNTTIANLDLNINNNIDDYEKAKYMNEDNENFFSLKNNLGKYSNNNKKKITNTNSSIEINKNDNNYTTTQSLNKKNNKLINENIKYKL